MWEMIERLSDASAYGILAGVGTLLFVIKLVMVFMGGDHPSDGGDLGGDVSAGDAVGDVHAGGDDAAAHDSGFHLLSMQSILAFFMGVGWMGLAARLEWKLSGHVTLLLAMVFGFLMMLLSATLSFYSRKLNKEGRYDVRSAIGDTGKVYLRIPPRGQGEGQVEINVSGRRKIVQAISENQAIEAFSLVKVLSVEQGNRLVVRKCD